MAGLRPEMRVLDVGCGLGGTARHLASAAGVEVIGLDSCRAYVRLAQLLTRRAGGEPRVRFECGHAESTPFATASFDCAWLQHVLPNIIDKARLFASLRRILVGGGVLALHEIVARDGGRLRYPLPWSDSPANSFVPAAPRLRIALESAGFVLEAWRDTTAAAHEWCGRTIALRSAMRRKHPLTPFDLAALRNLESHFEDGRLGVAMAIFRNGRQPAPTLPHARRRP